MKVVKIAIVIPYRLESGVSVWMQKRQSNDELNGHLEFPGGKVEEGESIKEAAIREVYEEVGVQLNSNNLKFLKKYDDIKTGETISLNIFSYRDRGEFVGPWYDEPKDYWDKIPSANQMFLEEVLNSLKTGT